MGLDTFQLLATGTAVVACLLVLRMKGGHRAVWIVLIGALLFSGLQSYAEYLELQTRLGQLHGDVIAETQDIQEQLLQARYDAENLDADLAEWAVATGAQRASLEVRVSAVLANLDGRTSGANDHLQGLVTRLNATAPQPGQSLTQSTLVTVRNLAEGSVQETRAMWQTLQGIEQAWATTRSAPGATEQLQYAVNPRLWIAIDTARASADRLGSVVDLATTTPVGDLFVVIVVLNLSTVLFPWLLLLLFVTGRRDARLRKIYLDLWDLGGGNDLLARVLDNVDETVLRREGYKRPEVRRALEERTFSDVEYLLCLGVLTILLTAGWHMVLYPLGALGLAQLVVNGVSVREFAMYVVGNLNVITLGFLGAYFYSTGVLIRRFFASDLYPSAFLQMISRMIAVFVISLVLAVLVPIAMLPVPDPKFAVPVTGLPVAPNGGLPLEGFAALAGALAFFFGIWTRSFTSWLARVISAIPIVGKLLNDPQASVAELEGVDLWVEGRLDEEGIETVQAMATVAIERLVRRTYFSTALIVCWVDQALLYMHAGNDGQLLRAFRAAGIHKATDLVAAVGYDFAVHVRNQQPVPTPVDLDSIRPAVDTLVQATAGYVAAGTPPLSAQTVFEVCLAVWHEPNLRYLRNFYAAHSITPTSAHLPNGLASAPAREAVGP